MAAHIAFAVEDIDGCRPACEPAALNVGELERYEDSYQLCYVRGVEGIIIELAASSGAFCSSYNCLARSSARRATSSSTIGRPTCTRGWVWRRLAS